MKDVKDYLHLYLGCKVRWKYIAPDDHTEWSEWKELNAAKLDALWFVPSNEIQIQLRQLSSMTEEEMKALFFLVFNMQFTGDNITHRDVGKKEERWVLWSGLERLFIYKDGDVGADCDLQYVRAPYHKIFLWQLSKGFDLFGLIESGLAIDSSEMKAV